MPRLLLTILIGGTALGAGAAQLLHPTMKFAEGPDWRERYRIEYSAAPTQFVDALPQDLSPNGQLPPDYAAFYIPAYAPPPMEPFSDPVIEEEEAPEAELAAAEAAQLADRLTDSSSPGAPSEPVRDEPMRLDPKVLGARDVQQGFPIVSPGV